MLTDSLRWAVPSPSARRVHSTQDVPLHGSLSPSLRRLLPGNRLCFGVGRAEVLSFPSQDPVTSGACANPAFEISGSLKLYCSRGGHLTSAVFPFSLTPRLWVTSSVQPQEGALPHFASPESQARPPEGEKPLLPALLPLKAALRGDPESQPRRGHPPSLASCDF